MRTIKQIPMMVLWAADKITTDPLNAKLCRFLLRFGAAYAAFQVIRGLIMNAQL
jgi:hypothetical protein